MMPVGNRLGRGEGFDDTIRRGRRFGDKRMVLHYLAPSENSAGEPLVGITVAKRQIPLAHDRNRVKRQLRHLLHDRLEAMPNGAKVVVRALRGAGGLSSDELGASLDRLLIRAMGDAERPAKPQTRERK